MFGRVLLAATVLVLSVAVPAAAQDGGACVGRFPEVDWTRVDAPVEVYAGAVPEGHAIRYSGEITGAVAQINSYYGEFDATVCLFDRDSGLDTSPYVSGSNRLHAMLFTDEALLVIATDNVGLTGSAAAFGLAQIALWQFADGAFPEPQASTISQFFQSEVRSREVMDHAEAKAANFYTPAAATEWSSDTQQLVMMWDPSLGRSAANLGPTGPAAAAASPASTHTADLVRFGMAEHGDEFLTVPEAAVWAETEAQWREALTVELMGTDEPTTTWRAGLAIAIGIVVLAVIAATLGYISKRRGKRRPETPEPIPGFFDGSGSSAG